MSQMSRRTHPTPSRFAREVEELIDTLDDLIPLYEEADGYVEGRIDKPRDDTGRISGLGVSDPTGETVAEQEGNKRRLQEVTNAIREIRTTITDKSGPKETLLKMFDPAEWDSLAAFRSKGYGPDRRSRALDSKIQRLRKRLRDLERYRDGERAS